ncbi:hypothetical protein BGZ49_006129, partial [Haplosporangium sp. Z 27]
ASSFQVVQPFSYEELKDQTIGLAGKHQLGNAALASAICRIWIEKVFNVKIEAPEGVIPKEFSKGLSSARWPGRGQIIIRDDKPKITWFFDGAHTAESVQDKKPGYFRFLTILAFHVFKQEKVDVAILEVGIGGAYDSTNIIKKPIVCAIAALGIDHVSVLGSTLGEIAWNKGGIFKSGVPAVSCQQPEEGLSVLQSRAKELG